MNKSLKTHFSNGARGRAEACLFLIDVFLLNHNANDSVYFRPILILLPYVIELALKSRIIDLSESTSKEVLVKELKDYKHNLVNIGKRLGTAELKMIGIEAITVRSGSSFAGYTIKTSSGVDIPIENFTDVRYDFLVDDLRALPENDEVKSWIAELHEIIDKIRKANH